MKQQCHILMVYLSWMVYAGGLIFAVWRASWLFAAAWLIAAPAGQWLYIRYFPKFSTAMGYGPITDEPAEAAHAELPLAILRAFVEARRRLSFAAHADAPDPQLRPAPEMPVCCDNFA